MRPLILVTLLLALPSCSPKLDYPSALLRKSSIINGSDLSPSDSIARSVVGLYNAKKNISCTGTLIAPNIVLTAAHCVPERASHMKVVFATNIDYTINAREQDVLEELVLQVTDYKVGPTWDPEDEDREHDTGDIALIKFKGTMPENYKLASFLTDETLIKVGGFVTVAGYGFNTVTTTPVDPNKVQELEKAILEGDIVCDEEEKGKEKRCVSVEMSGDSILRKTEVPISSILDTEFILDERKSGTCNGDSGGPAFIQKNGEYYLLGVTSRGTDLCNEEGAYTNALKYKTWIDQASTLLR